MSPIDLHHAEHLPTMFTVELHPEPRIHRQAIGAPVELLDDDGLRIWTPILGPASGATGPFSCWPSPAAAGTSATSPGNWSSSAFACAAAFLSTPSARIIGRPHTKVSRPMSKLPRLRCV